MFLASVTKENIISSCNFSPFSLQRKVNKAPNVLLILLATQEFFSSNYMRSKLFFQGWSAIAFSLNSGLAAQCNSCWRTPLWAGKWDHLQRGRALGTQKAKAQAPATTTEYLSGQSCPLCSCGQCPALRK